MHCGPRVRLQCAAASQWKVRRWPVEMGAQEEFGALAVRCGLVPVAARGGLVMVIAQVEFVPVAARGEVGVVFARAKLVAMAARADAKERRDGGAGLGNWGLRIQRPPSD
jgi:hypothetical protein